MELFDKDVEHCADCGAEMLGGREMGATACLCKDCRKQWSDSAAAAIAETAVNSKVRRKAEAGRARTY